MFEILEERCVPAHYTVNSLLDSDGGSIETLTLRDALEYAQVDSEDVTIDFSVEGQIFVRSALPTIYADDSFTIRGPGSDKLEIRGHNGSVFVVSALTDATISGLTISKGYTELGGGIRNEGNLTIEDTVFSENTADYGGAIYNLGTLTIKRTTFNANLAQKSGGAIYSRGIVTGQGHVTVINSTFESNYANNIEEKNHMGGGAIYTERGSLTVRDSTFSENFTLRDGGGGGAIHIHGSDAKISDSQFTENKSNQHHGGAIFQNSGKATVERSTFSKNEALDGGGIYIDFAPEYTLYDSTFTGNKAFYSGGAVYNAGFLTVGDSSFTNNTADNGGGISNQNSLIVHRSTLSQNTAITQGGGVENLHEFTIDQSTIGGNKATLHLGGGIYNEQEATSNVTNTTISGNFANWGGGGIYTDGDVRLTNATIVKNSTTQYKRGGGILQQNGLVTLHNTLMDDNFRGTATDWIQDDITGSVAATSSGNLIGDGTDMTGISQDEDGNYANGNLVGSAEQPIDSRYGPLQDNGGPTFTHELLPGSPAIDAGTNNVALDKDGKPLSGDQRGEERIAHSRVDIGAFELANKPIETAPKLISPPGRSADISPTFSWTAVEHALKYELWVDKTSSKEAGVIHVTLAGTSFTAGTTMEIGAYRVWTRGLNVHGEAGPWSAGHSFQIVAPAAPAFTAPASETIEAKPSFLWNSVEGAAKYELWVNNVTTGASGVIQERGLIGASFTAKEEMPLGEYRAWVRASNENGQAGAWSAGHSFSIVSILTPTIAQIDTSANTSPEVRWESGPNAVSYKLWINNATTGKSKYFYRDDLQENSVSAWPKPFAIGSYDVWVQAVNENGDLSKWSAAERFTIVAPSAPVLSAPAGETTDKTPDFTWIAVTGADRYELWVNNVTSKQSKIIHEPNLGPTGEEVFDYTPSADLPAGSYRGWIRAINALGQSGAWSQTANFDIVNLLTPTVQVAAAKTAETKPTIVWTGVAGAASYELWVNNASTGASGVIYETGLQRASFVPEDHLPIGAYDAWVRAKNAAGQTSKWSAAYRFEIVAPAAPVLTGPTGVTGAKPTFTWNAVQGATHYELWVSNLSIGNAKAIHETDLPNTFHTATAPLLDGEDYRTWVRAVNALGESGAWSDPLDFTVVV